MLRVSWEIEAYRRSVGGLSPARMRAYAAPMRSGSPSGPGGRGRRAPPTSTVSSLRRYLAFLATRRYSKATISRTAASLRSYFRWCARRGLLAADPAARLAAPSPDSRLPRVLGHGELGPPARALRRPTPGVPARDRSRDDAVLELLYGGGLRVAELCGPRRRGTSTFERWWLRVTGKGSKQRQVLIHEGCARARRGVAGRPQGGPAWRTTKAGRPD